MSKLTKIGLPPGGSTGEVLKKKTGTNYDVEWGTGGGGGSGSVTSVATTSPITGGTITTTGTIGITQATTSTDGYLSSTDWNTFNGKQNALTNPVTGTGTTNELAYFTGSTTIASLTTGTYPSLTELSYVKGVTSAIQTQLNGKQATLTNPVTGTGTSGQVAYWSGTTTQTGSNNLFWDNTNARLGIGTNAPAVKLDVVGNTTTLNTAQFGTIGIQSYALNNCWYGENLYYNGSNFIYRSTGYGSLNQFYNGQSLFSNFNTQSAGSAATASSYKSSWKSDFNGNVAIGGNINSALGNFSGCYLLVVGSTGNILIGTTTDSGYKLDVNGTARIQDNLTISDAKNVILGTTTGTKIGTATTQKLGFFNATPVVQPSSVTTSQGIADALSSLGLLATSSITLSSSPGEKLYLFNSY